MWTQPGTTPWRPVPEARVTGATPGEGGTGGAGRAGIARPTALVVAASVGVQAMGGLLGPGERVRRLVWK
jgi:hypothetical protein